MKIEPFFDAGTATFSYVVSDEASRRCAVVDPVLDYDDKTKETSARAADRLLAYVKEQGLTVEWILETHIHADHLTASGYLKEKLGAKVGIGAGISKVLAYWVPELKLKGVPCDGSQFDRLFADNETFAIGGLKVKVLHTPGHTPACASYLIGDAVFVGDTIFMPRSGTARADFPGGSAAALYRSIHRLYELPDATRIFLCHDYPPAGEEPQCRTTVGEQKKHNKMVGETVDEATYVRIRSERDATLSPPRLLLPSLRFNLSGGRMNGFSQQAASG